MGLWLVSCALVRCDVRYLEPFRALIATARCAIGAPPALALSMSPLQEVCASARASSSNPDPVAESHLDQAIQAKGGFDSRVADPFPLSGARQWSQESRRPKRLFCCALPGPPRWVVPPRRLKAAGASRAAAEHSERPVHPPRGALSADDRNELERESRPSPNHTAAGHRYVALAGPGKGPEPAPPRPLPLPTAYRRAGYGSTRMNGSVKPSNSTV
jgi:hypothetical protein